MQWPQHPDLQVNGMQDTFFCQLAHFFYFFQLDFSGWGITPYET